MYDIYLKKGKERSLLRRHPWVYDTAIGKVAGRPGVGETVRVLSCDGRFLGFGAYSPQSTLRVRMWSFEEKENVEVPGFVEERLKAALKARQTLLSRTSARRVVFGEADGLPGLIVDAYGDYLVTQFLSAAVEARREVILNALVKIANPKGIFDRSDAATRDREGLDRRVGSLYGEEPPEYIPIVEDGVNYGVDVRKGHKTGFYIDQRESRLAAQLIARRFKEETGRGIKALNCFCYTGGFSLALARGGAAKVVSVDSSADALEQAKKNAAMNDFSETDLTWVEADVFEFLRAEREKGETYDLVILDPPKFASNHRQVDRASRAYKDINLNGMRLLTPSGHLMTFSCSGAIDVDLFQKIVAGAVFDANRTAWALERFGAGSDHPLLMTYPEGEYLKGLHLVMRDREKN